MSDDMANHDSYAPGVNGDEMEARLRRLESAIAAISDTKLMEERLIERVMTRVPPVAPIATPPTPAPPTALPVPPNMLIEAGKALIPGALTAVGTELNAATDPRNAHASTSIFAPRNWLLIDLMQEVRSMWAMFFDHRFRPGWTVRSVPLICLTIFIVSLIALSAIFQYVLVVPLVVIAYKSLAREAARYRQEVAHLPPRF